MNDQETDGTEQQFTQTLDSSIQELFRRFPYAEAAESPARFGCEESWLVAQLVKARAILAGEIPAENYCDISTEASTL